MGLSLLILLAQGSSDSGQEMLDALEREHELVLERVAPAVVAIRVQREAAEETPADHTPPGRRAGGPFGSRPKNATLSGVILDGSGYVLTSHFNVRGKIRAIEVIPDGREPVRAKLIGFDASLDIALLRVPGKDLPTLERAPVDSIRTGQRVYAVGRAPGGKGVSLNPGVISATGRFGGRLVQTDAHLNFGNVGGPLVDRYGRLIGVTCKIDTRFAATYGQNSGVGFAARWDKIQEVLPRLKQGARIAADRRPYIGISYDPNSVDLGVKILDVLPDTAAAKAGLKPGDVIIEFDGLPVENPTDLLKILHRHDPGDVVRMKLKREGKVIELQMKLGEREIRD